MKFSILTLFPEMFSPMRESMTGRAMDKGLLSMDTVNIRDYSTDRHSRADDYSFGGGPGMIMMAEPIFGALEAVGTENKRLIYMSPKGKLIDRNIVEELSQQEEVVILCGHYEGVDQRVLDSYDFQELSIGDYVLTGGELPAMVLMDVVARMIPGVLSTEEGVTEESVYSGLLEYPQYTRPTSYRGMEVPEVLLSGDHGRVDLWRFEQSLLLTLERRKDLFDAFVKKADVLPKDKKKIVEKILELL